MRHDRYPCSRVGDAADLSVSGAAGRGSIGRRGRHRSLGRKYARSPRAEAVAGSIPDSANWPRSGCGRHETLQRNLILSHCCGVGEPMDIAATRLTMALKLLSLGRGASGVRWKSSPDRGYVGKGRYAGRAVAGFGRRVGRSGAAGAHDLVMIGAGEAVCDGETMPGAEALARAGLTPVVLGPRKVWR